MKFIKLTILFLVVLSAQSCKKWLDINTDPSNPQVATGEVLIGPIQFQMANNLANDYRFLFKYVQYWTNQSADPTFERHGYDAASDNGGSIWRMTYFNHGKNLDLMIKDGEDNQKWSFAGIGLAIKAWDYQITTDYHGPIILDDAFDPSKLTFSYQDQPEVYTKVREWCYKALDYLGRTDAQDYSAVLGGSTGDQIYKGDRAKWKKFIYGLLALHYSHLRNKPEFTTAYADSVIKFVDLSFIDESEDATIFFNASNSGESNPFGTSTGLLTYSSTSATLWSGRVSQPIVNYLTGGVRGTPTATSSTTADTKDPRLTRMIAPNPDNIYRGVVPTQGDLNATKRIPHVLGSVAAPYPGKYIFADKARFPIMTYSQLQFAQAEAYLVKNKPVQAHAAYLKGIDGHMDFVNRYGLNGTTPAPAITGAQIAAYKASSEVAQTPAQLTIADIMGQKYIAQWGWAGLEQWCDLRKYHYDPTVFKQYYQLATSEFFSQNVVGNVGKYAYRVRPRYNSEYVWNRDELARWGGLDPDYQTKELWFSLP